MSFQEDITDKKQRARALKQGWWTMVWLVAGLIAMTMTVMVLWWQSIASLTGQTDDFYRRNVVARKIASDVHGLSRQLHEAAELSSPRRLEQKIGEIEALVQGIVLESRELQVNYMGAELPGGIMQRSVQLQNATRRLLVLLEQDLRLRGDENDAFGRIARSLLELRRTASQHANYDAEQYRRLIRVVNASSTGRKSGENVLMIGRMLEAAVDVVSVQINSINDPGIRQIMRKGFDRVGQDIIEADLLLIARRRLDTEREMALQFRQINEEFVQFNEELLGHLDVFDRNEVRDARQTMSLVLNLHAVLTAIAILVSGFLLVSFLRNRLIEPLGRQLTLLEQTVPDTAEAHADDAGLDPEASMEELVLQRARHRLERENALLDDARHNAHRFAEETRRTRHLAESASDSQNAFLASLSHQIRTPMNGVTGMLEVLQRGTLGPEQRNLLHVVQDSCDSLLRILDDVRDFSRLEAGQLTLVHNSFVLEDVVLGVAEMARSRSLEKGLELSACVDAALPRSFVGDAVRLRQVLGHLLNFIIDNTDRGAVSLYLTSMTPRVSPVLLRVQIIGTGMPSEDVSRWRKGGTGWLKGDGDGEDNVQQLGMMISDNIVSLMGGQVEPITGAAHTSGFTFEVPLESFGAAGEGIEFDLGGMRIALADPGVMSRRTLENYLTADQARLLVFETYQDLDHDLRSFAAGGDPVDLLILSPSFESGEYMDALVTLVEELGDKAPRLLVLTRSDDQRLPGVLYQLDETPMTISQPLRRLSLARTVAVAAGRLDDSLLRQSVEETAQRWQAPERAAAEAAGAVLLVAEDDSTARLVIGKQLDELGYVHDIVNHGEAALEALAGNDCYGMILMDCFMPHMDGFEATGHIRNGSVDNANRHIPIAAMTASTEPREIERCYQCGMNVYMGKPVTLDKIDEVIAAYMPRALDLRRRVDVDPEAAE